MQFKSFAYFASTISLALGASVQDLLTSLANLKSSVTTLDSAVNGFPSSGGSLAQALAIHTDATNTQSVIESATTTAKAVTPQPVTEADGQTILSAVNGIVPIIEDALTVIVERKPAFQALPIGGIPALVLQDLTNLNASDSALESALVALAPNDLLAEANDLVAQVNAAFAKAIAAYE